MSLSWMPGSLSNCLRHCRGHFLNGLMLQRRPQSRFARQHRMHFVPHHRCAIRSGCPASAVILCSASHGQDLAWARLRHCLLLLGAQRQLRWIARWPALSVTSCGSSFSGCDVAAVAAGGFEKWYRIAATLQVFQDESTPGGLVKHIKAHTELIIKVE